MVQLLRVKTQKIVCTMILAAIVAMGIMTGCSEKKTENTMSDGETPVQSTNASTVAEETANSLSNEVNAPKYVFLFIGDGMSYPQFQAASDYLGACADSDYEQAEPSIDYEKRNGAFLDGSQKLNFMNFETEGSAITFDSCSFAPDSASTATSIATGNKTYSGMINVDVSGTEQFETIAEKLHEQKKQITR